MTRVKISMTMWTFFQRKFFSVERNDVITNCFHLFSCYTVIIIANDSRVSSSLAKHQAGDSRTPVQYHRKSSKQALEHSQYRIHNLESNQRAGCFMVTTAIPPRIIIPVSNSRIVIDSCIISRPPTAASRGTDNCTVAAVAPLILLTT